MFEFFALGQVIAPSAPGGGTDAPPAAPAAPATPAPATPAVEGATNTSAEGSPTPPAGEAPKQQPNPFGGMLLPFILIMVVMYFFLMRGPRKEEKKRKAMLAEMKKGDQVMTIGGVKGSIVDIREDKDEVVVKVDESNNIKIRFARSAIQRIFTEDEPKS